MVVGLDFWRVFFVTFFFSLKIKPKATYPASAVPLSPSPSTDTVFIIVSHFSLHFADIFLELIEHVGQTGSRYFRGFPLISELLFSPGYISYAAFVFDFDFLFL